MIIGITGGIGSGKSTIARALAARGYAIYDCDKEAKRIIAEDQEVQQQIIALFGKEAFINGVYNTAYVASRVFAEPELLKQLNGIVHPAVKADIEWSAIRFQHSEFFFFESAILYEAGLDGICDRIILVEAPEEVRIARTLQRDYHGEATEENINKVRARIQAQKAVSHQQSAISNQPSAISHQLSAFSHLLVVHNDGKASIDKLVSDILKDL